MNKRMNIDFVAISVEWVLHAVEQRAEGLRGLQNPTREAILRKQHRHAGDKLA